MRLRKKRRARPALRNVLQERALERMEICGSSTEVFQAYKGSCDKLVDEKNKIVDNLEPQKCVVSMNFAFTYRVTETVIDCMLHEGCAGFRIPVDSCLNVDAECHQSKNNGVQLL
jgi:hypothetical protein